MNYDQVSKRMLVHKDTSEAIDQSHRALKRELHNCGSYTWPTTMPLLTIATALGLLFSSST